MKCAACHYEGQRAGDAILESDQEPNLDFIPLHVLDGKRSQGEIIYKSVDPNSERINVAWMYVKLYACPKCGTVRMEK